MIDKEVAMTVHRQAISAIEALHDALTLTIGKCPEEDFELIRYGVGSSIAVIYSDLLGAIYEMYPELNDLK